MKLNLIAPPTPFTCPYCKINKHEYDGTGGCLSCAKEHGLKPQRYKYQVPKEKKPPKPIAKESEKRKALNKINKAQNKQLVKDEPFCKIKSPVCTGWAESAQHVEGRKEGNLIDMTKKISACNACNLWCETHPNEAKLLKVAGSKHKSVKKVSEVIDEINAIILTPVSGSLTIVEKVNLNQ